MSEEHQDDGKGGAADRPAQESTPEPASERAAQHGDKGAVGLSLEEKGMVTMPAVPVPKNEVDIGNMPAGESGSGGEGSSSGGGEGPGSSDSGE